MMTILIGKHSILNPWFSSLTSSPCPQICKANTKTRNCSVFFAYIFSLLCSLYEDLCSPSCYLVKANPGLKLLPFYSEGYKPHWSLLSLYYHGDQYVRILAFSIPSCNHMHSPLSSLPLQTDLKDKSCILLIFAFQVPTKEIKLDAQ